MAIRYIGNTGTSSGTDSLTVSGNLNYGIGDLLILHVTYAGYPSAISTPSGWTLLTTVSQSTNVIHGVFYKFTTASGTSVSVTLAKNSLGVKSVGSIFAYRGVDKTNPINTYQTANGNLAASLSLPGLTTTVDNCLVLSSTGYKTSSAAFSNWANSDLESITELYEHIVDTTAGLVITNGSDAQKGSVTNTTATVTNYSSSYHASVVFALTPSSVPFISDCSAVGSGVSPTVTINVPTTYAEGDLLILLLHGYSGTVLPATPDGWTLLDTQQNTHANFKVCYKIASSSEQAVSVDFTGCLSGRGVMIAIENMNPNTPINTFSKSSSSSTAYSADGPTITLKDCLIMVCVGFYDSTSTSIDTDSYSSWVNTSLLSITEHVDWHKYISSAGGGGIALASGICATSGTVANTTATTDSTANYSSTFVIAIAPIVTAPPVYVNIDNVWIQADSVHMNISNTWTSADSVTV